MWNPICVRTLQAGVAALVKNVPDFQAVGHSIVPVLLSDEMSAVESTVRISSRSFSFNGRLYSEKSIFHAFGGRRASFLSTAL